MKPRFRPVIRVFVSSTFSDLKAERNILQSDVFPRLEQYCLLRGFQFQAIDLRWGVPGEAGLDHRTMQICFDELRRAQEVSPKPNFLVLLGDRYGWQPLAEVVTKHEFKKLEEAAARLDRRRRGGKRGSEKAQEILRTWYRRDDNAVPPEYVLRSRHEWPDGQHFTKKREKEEWAKVEAALWAVINRAYRPKGLARRFRHIPGSEEPLPSIVKFQGSATEQEIWRGALAVPDARDHVVAWYRTIRNRRQYLGDDRAKDFFDKDATLHGAASRLRDQLSRKLRKRVRITPVKVDLRPVDNGKRLEVTRDHLVTMCNDIEKKLMQIIEKEIRQYWHPTTGVAELQESVETTGPSEARKLELERLAHQQFGESRAPKGRFIGRKKELQAIAKYLSDENDHKPLVVYGPSGAGKTALLARAAQSAAGAGRRILVRFLGTTPQSSNLRSLLTNLCRTLRPAGEDEKEVSAELRELQDEFDKHLALATPDQPIFLFLDALDQLDEADGARQTYWLRTPLPPHVKAVISCICDLDGPKELNEPYIALEQRKLVEGEDGQRRAIALESLPPREAMELLYRWLEHADPTRRQKRRLTRAQRKAIVARIAARKATTCCRPLYLRVLFEQCRHWPSYKKEVKSADLGKNTAGLLQGLFHRLAEPAIHGRILVESALSYIASARRGLSENEILEILWADREYKKHLDAQTKETEHELPAGATRIPIAIWSRLRHDLDPYLAEHAAPGGAVLNFYHREVFGVVEKRFLNGRGQRLLRHGNLAKYFQSELQPWWRDVDASRQVTEATAAKRFANARRASELPWQLLRVAEASDPHSKHPAVWDASVKLLCDMEFVEVKCCAGLVFELQEDYRDARTVLPEAQAELRAEEARKAETATWTKQIIEYARQWGERRDRIQRGERVDEIEPVLPKPPATRQMWTNKRIEAECRRIRETPTRLDRLASFAGFVQGECYPLVHFGARDGFVLQHAFNYAPGGPVHDAAAGPLARCAAPLLLRHWPEEAIWNPKPAMLRTVEGHSTRVTSVSVTPDGRRAVSGSEDKTLRVWDLDSGACLRALEGHSYLVHSVSVTPDGRRAVSGSDDGTLRVWDLESGACLRTLEGHRDDVRSVSVTPDGRRAVSGGGSEDKTLRVWDLESGACLRVLGGHSKVVTSVSVTPDGLGAVSGSLDQTLRVWDLERGACLRTLKGHGAWVTSVSVTPDGRRAVSGSGSFPEPGKDNTLRVWDLERGVCLRTLEGHRQPVECVSVTPDGRRAVSGSQDNTLRVWDLESGACLRTLEGYGAWVMSVSVTPDGRRAVSGSADKMVRVWDLENSACTLEGHSASVWSLSVTPDGRRAVSGSDDKTLRVWDLESGACLRTLKGHGAWVTSVSITPDGKRAVSGSWDETLRVWNLRGGRCEHILEGHTGAVARVSVTPDGRRAVSGSHDKTLRVWDLESGACLRTLEGHSEEVASVSVTPDGRRAVSGSLDEKLRVWDLESGACLRTLKGHSSVVDSVSVTPDGRLAVSGSQDKTLRVWDLESGACLHTLEGHSDVVWSVSVTPDGRRAVSGSYDKTLRVWDLESGACLRTLEGHGDGVKRASVTPDGRRPVSGSRDKTLRVWDLESGACLAVFAGTAPVEDVAIFSGLLTVGTQAGQVLSVEMRSLPLGPPIRSAVAPDIRDTTYEALLRRGLDRSRREKGPDHEEALAHLVALAVHLERIGKTDEARPFREEHDRICSELVERRVSALQAYQAGDYAHAERLLRSLLADRFEVPSTHCHLGRILLIQDRIEEAETETSAAWEHRAEAPSYVVPRILWLHLALLYACPPEDPTEEEETDSASVILGGLKTALAREDAYLEWEMDPVLVHLQARLPAEKYQLLAALVAALSDATNLPALEQFPAWRDAQAEPLG